MKVEKVIIGVVGGIALGCLAGILFAPEKGAETRKKIAKTQKNQTDELVDTFSKFFDIVIGKTESLKGNTKELAKKKTLKK